MNWKPHFAGEANAEVFSTSTSFGSCWSAPASLHHGRRGLVAARLDAEDIHFELSGVVGVGMGVFVEVALSTGSGGRLASVFHTPIPAATRADPSSSAIRSDRFFGLLATLRSIAPTRPGAPRLAAGTAFRRGALSRAGSRAGPGTDSGAVPIPTTGGASRSVCRSAGGLAGKRTIRGGRSPPASAPMRLPAVPVSARGGGRGRLGPLRPGKPGVRSTKVFPGTSS